jgi:hypothetical protein
MAVRAAAAGGFNPEVFDADAAIAEFNDGTISGWAKNLVAAAVKAGIILGQESGDFAPSACATRAEAATELAHIQAVAGGQGEVR